jgi:radical SAM protein (TIGR01212 family)
MNSSSTISSPVQPDSLPPAWRAAGLRYHAYSHYLRNRFGVRVHRVSVDAGFTCPNVDGTVATGGCVFCDNRSFSPSRRLPRLGVTGQLDEGIRRVSRRYPARAFLAYFQPATNTYGPVDHLRRLFEEALTHPQVVGLVVGTRPDCVPDDVLDLLAALAARAYVSVEYGLQSIHDRSLSWMNRGHGHASFVDAVERSRGRGFELCAHVILGLPTETRDDMLATAREVARLRLDAVKLHNLYAVRGTPLGEWVERGEVPLMERDDYVRVAVDFLELLPPECVVERVHGEAPPDFLVGPGWCRDKPGLRRALEEEFARRDSWQGKLYAPPAVQTAD